MAKVLITGLRKLDFTAEDGQQIKGTNLFYKYKLEPYNGLFAGGYCTEKVWLRSGSQLEAKMLSANYDKPFEVDMTFDLLPGSKRPALLDIAF